MQIEIKKAKIEDLPVIQQLNQQLFELEFHNFDSSLKVGWPFTKEGEAYFRNIIENEVAFVAVVKEEVIGYLAGIVDTKNTCIQNPIAKLDNFYVIEAYRRQGIGTKLLDEFKQYCSKQGVKKMKVTANTYNENAIQFYRKNGFRDYEVVLSTKI